MKPRLAFLFTLSLLLAEALQGEGDATAHRGKCHIDDDLPVEANRKQRETVLMEKSAPHGAKAKGIMKP